MYDQSFSAKSLQEIFDSQNRKGVNIEQLFTSEFAESKRYAEDLKNINRSIRHTHDKEAKLILLNSRKELKKLRDKEIDSIMENISKSINKTNRIIIEQGAIHGRQSYKLENKIENFFISKKLQSNLARVYSIKQNSRYALLSELINILEDGFPKIVVRADIASFYESIPQKPLLEKIDSDHLLSIKSKQFIHNIIDGYNNIIGITDPDKALGVPRGVGISAYLAELYARKIDNKVKSHQDIVYYARYVDDIIAVFIPQAISKVKPNEYVSFIKDIIYREGLTPHPIKTQEYKLETLDSIITEEWEYNDDILTSKKQQLDNGITFLGYNIGALLKKKIRHGKLYSTKSLYVQLSINKVDKYKRRIKLSFEDYAQKHIKNKLSFRLLEARIKYLTSNTQLYNNKERVFVGIYYSNPLLTNAESLDCLQRSLKYYVYRADITPTQKEKLLTYNFIEGYTTKTFHKTPLYNKKYKNHNYREGDVKNLSNFGIISFGINKIISAWKYEEKH